VDSLNFSCSGSGNDDFVRHPLTSPSAGQLHNPLFDAKYSVVTQLRFISSDAGAAIDPRFSLKAGDPPRFYISVHRANDSLWTIIHFAGAGAGCLAGVSRLW
jgi:hypothetical protein